MSFREKMTQDEYERRSEGHGALWWCGRILVLTLVIGTFGILFWRLFSAVTPGEIKIVTPNQALYTAWSQAQEEGRELTIYRHDLDSITRAESNYGYFSVSDVLFIDEAQQVQFVLRYNNSTIRHLKEDYGLDALPDKAEDLYDVTLYVAYDLTPADPSDNDGNDPASVKFIRYTPTDCTAQSTTMYSYRRFVFDGVDMTIRDNPVLAVYIDIYYKGDVHYDSGDPYGTLIIYDYAQENIAYTLSSKDKDALEVWGKENGQ